MKSSPSSATKSPSSTTSFSQACNLLSQFLKEKRPSTFAAADLNLPDAGTTTDVDTKGTTTVPIDDATSGRPTTIMNLFPEEAGLGIGSYEQPAPQARQVMTIFYDGQVIVFDDLPGEKAKEIMDLAIRCSNTTTKETTSDMMMMTSPNLTTAGSCRMKFHASNLPIARKESLHRFLEKRKDRLSWRGPYMVSKEPRQLQSQKLQHLQGEFASSSSSTAVAGVPALIAPEEMNKSSSSSWLGLASAGFQLQL